MTLSSKARSTLVALGILATSLAAAPAYAAITDYEFQLVRTEVPKGDATIVSVRLVDKRTGKAVPDAVIFQQRVDMAPDGMEGMAGPIEAVPSTEIGVYDFKTGVSSPGGWRLSLEAKVQGEEGTLKSELVFKVLP